MRHDLCRIYGGVDRDAVDPLSAGHLQFVGGGAQHTANVPGVLHFQHAADTAAGAAHRVDLPDHADRDQGDQVGTDGRRRPVQLERRTVGQLGERPPDRRRERWNAKEAAAAATVSEQKGLIKPVITQEAVIHPSFSSPADRASEKEESVRRFERKRDRDRMWEREYFKKTSFCYGYIY